MVQRNEILKFINNYLEIELSKDRALNGLQVEGKEKVQNIAVGVSASKQLFEKAVEMKADMVIVHHGLFWGDDVPVAVKGFLKERISILLKNDITLLAYHLPLDRHNVIGNNAQLVNLFDVKHVEPFAKYKGSYIGFKAQLNKPQSLGSISQMLEKKLFAKPMSLDFGKDPVTTIAAVSGNAPDVIYQAIDESIDLFITGETTEYIQELARESSMNFISAGHYNSEKLGVIALGKLLEQEFDVKAQFIDVPNPV
jgi:dinuclear metal center YbgI/SA1388 family protein